MNSSDIHKFITHQPFQPFEIVLVDGRRFLVEHPDFVFAPPVPRATWAIVVDRDGAAEHINTLVISSVRPVNGASKHRAGRRKTG